MVKTRNESAPIGVCKLCLETHQLCRSHVIPEFLFGVCYDSLHRLREIDRRPRRWRYQQKGWREYLLCFDCEQFLNDEYEKPFKTQWLDQPKLPENITAPLLSIQGLDYETFKLFHLSVLWRAAVASTDQFAQVSLGPHEDRIRHMLREKEAGSPLRYSVFVSVLTQDQVPAYDVVMPPTLKMVDGHRMYETMYGGCAWGIVVSSHPLSHEWQRLILDVSGAVLAPAHDFRKFGQVRSLLRSYIANRQRFGWPNP